MPAGPPNRPGRPRDASRDEEILTAVLRLLEHTSYTDLTIAAIAREAGVGKPTLYLSWPNKASVVADAVVRVLSAEVADLHEDPTLLEAFSERYFRPRRRSAKAALERGVARGELAEGLDLDLAVDLLVGPVYYRL